MFIIAVINVIHVHVNCIQFAGTCNSNIAFTIAVHVITVIIVINLQGAVILTLCSLWNYCNQLQGAVILKVYLP